MAQEHPQRRVELFHVGPPKSGTTWIYRCLTEHPAVAAPARDAVHFFDMLFARGEAWYLAHYAGAGAGQRLFDPTMSYFASPWAPPRIAAHNPRARIAVCIRNPIERAFSHYWHEKKKGRLHYDFADILDNYDLFTSWLEPGFHAEHLTRYYAFFDRSQVLVQRFETLRDDPVRFLRELLSFYEIDADFAPSMLHETVNAVGPRRDAVGLGLYSVQKAMSLVGLGRGAGFLSRSALLSGKGEYVRGIPDGLFAQLLEICEPEIVRLEHLLKIDLGSWRERPDRPVAA